MQNINYSKSVELWNWLIARMIIWNLTIEIRASLKLLLPRGHVLQVALGVMNIHLYWDLLWAKASLSFCGQSMTVTYVLNYKRRSTLLHWHNHMIFTTTVTSNSVDRGWGWGAQTQNEGPVIDIFWEYFPSNAKKFFCATAFFAKETRGMRVLWMAYWA